MQRTQALTQYLINSSKEELKWAGMEPDSKILKSEDQYINI